MFNAKIDGTSAAGLSHLQVPLELITIEVDFIRGVNPLRLALLPEESMQKQIVALEWT